MPLQKSVVMPDPKTLMAHAMTIINLYSFSSKYFEYSREPGTIMRLPTSDSIAYSN
jgi:hypothetical protein